jgi:hypothetical protein
VEVISGLERRRRWSEEQKRAIAAEAFAPEASVSAVAALPFLNASADRGWIDAKGASDIRKAIAVLAALERLTALMRVELWWAPRMHPAGLGGLAAFRSADSDHTALKLRDRPHNIEQQLACSVVVSSVGLSSTLKSAPRASKAFSKAWRSCVLRAGDRRAATT